MANFQVIVVDDDAEIRSVVVDLLETIGGQTEEVGNGHLALDLVERRPPDLVVMDLNMPLMDGMRLVHSLRRMGFPAERIIVFSGSLDTGRVLRLTQMQVKHFFVKPVEPMPFLDLVKKVVMQQPRMAYAAR
jgi:CheY-like chemotaxis protein